MRRFIVFALALAASPALAQEPSPQSGTVNIAFTEQEARETVRLLDLALKHGGLQAGSAVYLAGKIEGAFQKAAQAERKPPAKPSE